MTCENICYFVLFLFVWQVDRCPSMTWNENQSHVWKADISFNWHKKKHFYVLQTIYINQVSRQILKNRVRKTPAFQWINAYHHLLFFPWHRIRLHVKSNYFRFEFWCSLKIRLETQRKKKLFPNEMWCKTVNDAIIKIFQTKYLYFIFRQETHVLILVFRIVISFLPSNCSFIPDELFFLFHGKLFTYILCTWAYTDIHTDNRREKKKQIGVTNRKWDANSIYRQWKVNRFLTQV